MALLLTTAVYNVEPAKSLSHLEEPSIWFVDSLHRTH